jgi:homogentisate 1,2-dioxygenase
MGQEVVMERQVASAHDIVYQTGWCYHNQLNGLRTSAPHVLPDPASLPPGVDSGQVREQEYTRGGFVLTAGHATAYLYRAHPGPSWQRDGIQRRHAEEVAPFWVTGCVAPSLMQACQPRKFQRAPIDSGHAVQNLRTLFYNRDVAIGVSTCTTPMPYFFRNADGDDLFFVHEGEGVVETEFGPLGLEPGYFVWIPRGTLYRIAPDSPQLFLFHVENYGQTFQKPETGITGDAALYYHRNIEVPTRWYSLAQGEFEVIVKQGGGFTAYRYDHHPCDVIGWDGDLAPFRFNIQDFKPITSWRAHIPPSAYCTFLGQGFEVCSFVPRPVETAERSLPVPFDHINHDRDEVLFYSEGVFFSKDTSDAGTITFHARGFSHGPHPRALQRARERREREGTFMFAGYFLLVETTAPLSVTVWAETLEDKDYINSWQP